MTDVIEQRIHRLINNLVPQSAFEGKYDSPETLQGRLSRYHTPGATIAVINNFEIEWARGFGIREEGTLSKVTPATLFQAGSVSKPIFALAVMRLVQEGRLSLDENINAYLTSWQIPSNENWYPRITLRQLLSHTAGLTVHGFPGYQTSELLPTVIQILNSEPPANTDRVEVNILPGLQFRYSGGGTTIAQQLLVDVLGKPFHEIMRSLVLDPLGMMDSTYEQPLSFNWAVRAATAHPGKGIPLKGKSHIYPEMAAAGLWTTAADLAKVGVELVKVLHEKESCLFLNRQTIQSMLSPQLQGQTATNNDFVGLGFFCEGKGDSFHFGHSGSNAGFVAQMRIYKNIGKGAIVMLNSNEGSPLLEEIMRGIAHEYEWPDRFPKERSVVALVHGIDYVGLYSTETGIQFHITSHDGHLLLQFERQPPLSLFPSSEFEFLAKATNTSVKFEKDDNGNIVGMTLHQSGNQIKTLKQTQR